MPSNRVSGADINRQHQIDLPGDVTAIAYNEWQMHSVLFNSGEWKRRADTLLHE